MGLVSTRVIGYFTNVGGLAFAMSNQLGIGAAETMIMQGPIQKPVMQRELANKMYDSNAYFLARYTSNSIILFGWILIMVMIFFWSVGIVTSLDNFCWIMVYAVLGTLVFSGQGFFLGLVCEESNVRLMNLVLLMFWTTTNGILANLGTVNPLIKVLSNISPVRFASEGLYRHLTEQV